MKIACTDQGVADSGAVAGAYGGVIARWAGSYRMVPNLGFTAEAAPTMLRRVLLV